MQSISQCIPNEIAIRSGAYNLKPFSISMKALGLSPDSMSLPLPMWLSVHFDLCIPQIRQAPTTLQKTENALKNLPITGYGFPSCAKTPTSGATASVKPCSNLLCELAIELVRIEIAIELDSRALPLWL